MHLQDMPRVTDCLIVPGGDTFGKDLHVRITGFYRIATNRSGTRILVPCLSDHPDLAALATYGHCGLFYRPWQTVFHSRSPWPEKLVAAEVEAWLEQVRMLSDNIHMLTSAAYPRLLARFPDLTSHERARIGLWLKDARARIQTPDRGPELAPSPGASTPA